MVSGRLGFPRSGFLAVTAAMVCASLTGCFSAPAQIISLDPNRGSTGVAADAPIRVVFDHQVQHESVARHFSVAPALAQCTDMSQAFRANGKADCFIQWLADQPGFVFQHPGATFAANVTYTFTLSAGVADVDGTLNSLDHRWDIAAAPAPALVAVNPPDGTRVPRDAPITFNFSRPMSEQTTASAISLAPEVPGLRVVRNIRDHGRFEVLPGRLLNPLTDYVLTVSPAATDEHRQALDKPYVIRFRTAAVSTTGHALILAHRSGEAATSLLLSQLAAQTPGEPIPGLTLRQATRCAQFAGCGTVSAGGALVTFRDAALAPGARWLAVVEADETLATAPTRLRIVDLSSDDDRTMIAGASLPAWSPDGTTVAFLADDGSIRLYRPATDTTSTLPAGGRLAGPPVWTGDGVSLALPVAAAAGRPAHVELAAPAVNARYSLPGLGPASDSPVTAPQGAVLAVRVRSASGAPTTSVIDLATGQPPRPLAGSLSPVGFSDSGTLIAIDERAPGRTVLVRDSLDSGDISPLATGAWVPRPATAAVALSGRQVGYVSADRNGNAQAVIANADGTGALPLTDFGAGAGATAIRFGG